MSNIESNIYSRQVELLIRLIPIIMEEGVFAIHGGSAINLFLKNLPRYSVDVDLTYIPLTDRRSSIDDINSHLLSIGNKASRSLKGITIVPKLSTCKLLCEHQGRQVKIEVNQTKRGIFGGEILTLPLSDKAQKEFSLYCEAKIVPLTMLYGGKIAAALSRQHPRDLFDVKYMEFPLSKCREGVIFNLLSSDRPIYESLAPNLIDQREAFEKQFSGMTDTPFTYEEFEATRSNLIKEINSLMAEEDKQFLISFESGNPFWEGYEFEYFKDYPSVQWKLLNLKKLAKQNPKKLQNGVELLKTHLFPPR
ncbi:MAG: nucleotidyl transferase AbiEii/AbiGii toxin family protein [Bacteroidales bacterium]|nr:nucleotidyl transferase AbiEii/AbiGii toxin family protein [Bacteroidales bacterium]